MPHPSEQHAQHDHLLVVSLAAGDLTGNDRDRAAAQIAACAECALLHDDLLAIARATAVLPAAVRPRDFQLTPEQAARLRPGGWRRFIAAFASPRLAVTRQLGVGLTTLGIAGLLVSTIGSMSLGLGGLAAGAPAAAPADQRELMSTDESGGGPQPAASAVGCGRAGARGRRGVRRTRIRGAALRGRGLGQRRWRHRPPAGPQRLTSSDSGQRQRDNRRRTGAAGVHARDTRPRGQA